MSAVDFYTDNIFDRAHKTGEEIKNDLPNLIRRAIEAKVWESRFSPATGKPFENVGQWLVAGYPLGPSLGDTRFAITYDETIVLCSQHPDVKDLLVTHRPVRSKGRPKTEAVENDGVAIIKPVREGGLNSRAYIEQRLSRDFKDIWKGYLAGEFRSARQAGIAAGFIKDGNDALMRLKSNWNKATKSQKKEFRKWLDAQAK